MDTQKLRVRLRKLNETVKDLRELPRQTLAEYLNDKQRQAVVERWLQISAQICIDTGASLIAELGLAAPEELQNIFTALGEAGIIPKELSTRMVGLTRFRNILVHDYLIVDPVIVHERLTNGLVDFDDFGRAVTVFIEKQDSGEGPDA